MDVGTISSIGNEVASTKLNTKGSTDLPPAPTAVEEMLSDLPELVKPLLAAGSSLSLDVLMDAIGDKIRQSETKAGMASIKANAEQRKLVNEEQLKKIEEQIDKLDKQSFWDKLGKAFSWIAAIAGVIASAVMVATGVGGALGVAGLALSITMLVNQAGDDIGQAIDGKGYGLTSLIGRGIDQISEGAGQWVKLGLDIGLTIASLAVNIGATVKVAKAGVDISKMAQMITKAANVTQSATSVLKGGAQTASSVYGYQAACSTADQKRLEAILEQMQIINDLTIEHMKKVIEENQKLTETTSDIVKENAATDASILTDGASQMV